MAIELDSGSRDHGSHARKQEADDEKGSREHPSCKVFPLTERDCHTYWGRPFTLNPKLATMQRSAQRIDRFRQRAVEMPPQRSKILQMFHQCSMLSTDDNDAALANSS